MSKKKIFPNGFNASKLNKFFKETTVGKGIAGLAQSAPVVGPIITNFKEDTASNPAGKLNLGGVEWWRIALGVGIAVLIAKGILTQEQTDLILRAMGL